MKYPTFYRTIQVDGLSIFYREAGPKGAPTLLLLHGFPSSSRMFEPLFARLSDRYHLVAPDYPGFGHSDGPDPKRFTYTLVPADSAGGGWIQVERGARPLQLFLVLGLSDAERNAYITGEPTDDARFVAAFAHALEHTGGYAPEEARRVAET